MNEPDPVDCQDSHIGVRRWQPLRRAFYPPPWPIQHVEGSFACPDCGYNLYTQSRIGRCPECGLFVELAFAVYARRRQQWLETQRAMQYGLVLVLLVIVFIVLFAAAFEP